MNVILCNENNVKIKMYKYGTKSVYTSFMCSGSLVSLTFVEHSIIIL